MTIELARRNDFDLDNYRRVAWEGEQVRFSEAALERMQVTRDDFLALLEREPDIVIYGVTTGYGQMANVRLSPEQRRAQASRPPYAAAASFGEPLPERVTRGIVFARLVNYVEGHAAASPELANAVAAMLSENALPRVPAFGAASAGEISGLAHLFTPLAQMMGLGEKEVLTLVNGSPCASALLADAVLAARRRLQIAVEVFALSIEAMRAPLDAYDAALVGLWGDSHEGMVLAALRGLLNDGEVERRPYQAPVSWRIVPRLLGQTLRALAQAEAMARTSLAAVTDNPVMVSSGSGGRLLSNGGFHNAAAYPALDNLAAAWADMALLCERHATKLMDGNVSLLPRHLMVDGGYIGCLAFAATDFVEQARAAAQRTFLPGPEGGGFGQNDVSVPTFAAWRKQVEAGRCLDANLAILAAVASQAFYATERRGLPALAERLESIRDLFPPVDSPRAPGPDAERLAARFTDEVFDPASPEFR